VLWQGNPAERCDTALLFSESASRHLVTVHPEHRDAFEAALSGNCFAAIGAVTAVPRLTITGLAGTPVVDADIYELKEAWQAPLREL
jgi:phosphoribosylformylglycinamidine synthase